MFAALAVVVLFLTLAAVTESFTTVASKLSRGIVKNRELSMASGQMPMVPFYPNKGSKDYQWMDIYNALGRQRTIFVGRFLDDEACNQLIASLIWLQGQNSKEPITLYFNIPGALGKPTFAVYDVMKRMTCPLITINMGLTVGMGALLCAAGSSGKRFAYPNARFLMGKAGLDDGLEGQATSIGLAVAEVMKDNIKLIGELGTLCGQPVVKIENDLKRDFYLTAPEAAAYGVIDKVLLPNQPIKIMRYRGEDDDVVTFGHFSEVRKVKAGPEDKLVKYGENNQEDFDEYASREMAKKGFNNGRKSDRPNPKDLKNGGGVNRFANSRCRPPGQNKPVVPKVPGGGGGGSVDDTDTPFKNTGW